MLNKKLKAGIIKIQYTRALHEIKYVHLHAIKESLPVSDPMLLLLYTCQNALLKC